MGILEEIRDTIARKQKQSLLKSSYPVLKGKVSTLPSATHSSVKDLNRLDGLPVKHIKWKDSKPKTSPPFDCPLCKNGKHWAVNTQGTEVLCPMALKDPPKFKEKVADLMVKRKAQLSRKGSAKQVCEIGSYTVQDVLVVGENGEFPAQVDSGSSANIMPISIYNDLCQQFKGFEEEITDVTTAEERVPTLKADLMDFQNNNLSILGVIFLKVLEVKSLDGFNLTMNKKVLPFLLATKGSNIVLGRPSCGRKGLNILRHLAGRLDSNQNDTLDVDASTWKLERSSSKIRFVASLVK
jgi:hypothetical protein